MNAFRGLGIFGVGVHRQMLSLGPSCFKLAFVLILSWSYMAPSVAVFMEAARFLPSPGLGERRGTNTPWPPCSRADLFKSIRAWAGAAASIDRGPNDMTWVIFVGNTGDIVFAAMPDMLQNRFPQDAVTTTYKLTSWDRDDDGG